MTTWSTTILSRSVLIFWPQCIQQMFNLSLSSAVVPGCWKVALISLILKKMILMSLGKIFDKSLTWNLLVNFARKLFRLNSWNVWMETISMRYFSQSHLSVCWITCYGQFNKGQLPSRSSPIRFVSHVRICAPQYSATLLLWLFSGYRPCSWLVRVLPYISIRKGNNQQYLFMRAWYHYMKGAAGLSSEINFISCLYQGSYVFRNSKIQDFPGLFYHFFQGFSRVLGSPEWKTTFTTNCNHYKTTMCSKCSDSILSSGF